MSKTYHINEELDVAEAVGRSETTQELLEAVNGKIERLEERKRRFYAEIKIPYSLEEVWQVLTDYEAFPEFMNNLKQIRRLEQPTGKIRLEKILIKKFMGMQFNARMVADVEQQYPYEIRENLVEGDFQSYSVCWQLNPLSLGGSKVGVNLVYDLLVVPKRIFPGDLVEYFLSQDVPKHILAVRQRVETLFGSTSS
jgi:ribosome-associated toxin RatA of RatAB toxin-antitoxin module